MYLHLEIDIVHTCLLSCTVYSTGAGWMECNYVPTLDMKHYFLLIAVIKHCQDVDIIALININYTFCPIVCFNY